MGRGLSWCPTERQICAKAWMITTEDSIYGPSPSTTTAFFRDALHRNVILLAPTSGDISKKYGERSPQTIYKFVRNDIIQDIQRFNSAMIVARERHGDKAEVDIVCMTIAFHIGLSVVFDTSYMTTGTNAFTPIKVWPNYFAYLEFKKFPKQLKSETLDEQNNNKELPKILPTSCIVSNDSISEVSIDVNIQQQQQQQHDDDDDDDEQSTTNSCDDQTFDRHKHVQCNKTNTQERDEMLKTIANALDSISKSQAGVLRIMKTNEKRTRLKHLKLKYKLIKRKDPEQAKQLLCQIDNVVDDILTNMETS